MRSCQTPAASRRGVNSADTGRASGEAAEPHCEGAALADLANSGPPPPGRKGGVEPQPGDLGAGPAACPLLRWEADEGGAQTPSGL